MILFFCFYYLFVCGHLSIIFDNILGINWILGYYRYCYFILYTIVDENALCIIIKCNNVCYDKYANKLQVVSSF